MPLNDFFRFRIKRESTRSRSLRTSENPFPGDPLRPGFYAYSIV